MRLLGKSGMTRKSSFLKRNLKTLLGVLISIIALYLFIDAVEYDGLVNEIKNFEILYIIYGLISLCLGYVMRIYRWSFILTKVDSFLDIVPFVNAR